MRILTLIFAAITYEAKMEKSLVLFWKKLDQNLSVSFILNRFRHESGDPDAILVRWDLLDRSQILQNTTNLNLIILPCANRVL